MQVDALKITDFIKSDDKSNSSDDTGRIETAGAGWNGFAFNALLSSFCNFAGGAVCHACGFFNVHCPHGYGQRNAGSAGFGHFLFEAFGAGFSCRRVYFCFFVCGK